MPLRVCINPGHGAGDSGAVARTGLTEAEVVGKVAHYLAVYSDDKFTYELKRQDAGGLGKFLALLRGNRPDVVISLHCNAPATDRHEAHVYYWEEDPDGRRCRASNTLAHCLVTTLLDCLVAEKGAVKTAPYMRGDKGWFTPGILRGTGKRAQVLAELGFISDPHVAAAMSGPLWQQNAARAIDKAMRRW